MWCMLQGVLPTAYNLRSRMVEMPSLCPVCALQRESAHHLLCWCPFARDCWSLTSVPLPGQFQSIMAWVSNLITHQYTEELCLDFMVCWALWSHQNNIVWRKQSWTTYQLLSFAGKTLREWRQAQQCKVMTQKSLEMPDSMPIRWNKSPYNWTKLNVDVAIFNNESSMGLGCCFVLISISNSIPKRRNYGRLAL